MWIGLITGLTLASIFLITRFIRMTNKKALATAVE
jgi:Na+-driven multidrug efflux pump